MMFVCSVLQQDLNLHMTECFHYIKT